MRIKGKRSLSALKATVKFNWAAFSAPVRSFPTPLNAYSACTVVSTYVCKSHITARKPRLQKNSDKDLRGSVCREHDVTAQQDASSVHTALSLTLPQCREPASTVSTLRCYRPSGTVCQYCSDLYQRAERRIFNKTYLLFQRKLGKLNGEHAIIYFHKCSCLQLSWADLIQVIQTRQRVPKTPAENQHSFDS